MGKGGIFSPGQTGIGLVGGRIRQGARKCQAGKLRPRCSPEGLPCPSSLGPGAGTPLGTDDEGGACPASARRGRGKLAGGPCSLLWNLRPPADYHLQPDRQWGPCGGLWSSSSPLGVPRPRTRSGGRMLNRKAPQRELKDWLQQRGRGRRGGARSVGWRCSLPAVPGLAGTSRSSTSGTCEVGLVHGG